jgi:hypothetical protein
MAASAGPRDLRGLSGVGDATDPAADQTDCQPYPRRDFPVVYFATAGIHEPMRFDIHFWHHEAPSVDLVQSLNAIHRKVDSIMALLDPLANEVTETKTIMESAVVLIEGIAAQLEEHKNEPAEIQRIADELNESSEKLAAAVQANTPTP